MNKQTIIEKIMNPLIAHGFKAYFVGGCVRDELLGKIPHDYDIVTSANQEQIHSVFSLPVVDINAEAFGIVVMNLDGENIEVAFMRTDHNCDGRHTDVEFVDTIEEDCKRRDLTINAMYEDADGNIFDPTSFGKTDIASQNIRFVGDLKSRCTEDNLRVLRAIRFASVLGFKITNDTMKDLEDICSDTKFRKSFESRVSGERIGNEMRKIICGKNAPFGVRLTYRLLGSLVFPDELGKLETLPSYKKYHSTDNNFEHTLAAFDTMCGITDRLDCRVAALFHDIGKVCTQNEYGHALLHEKYSAEITEKFLINNWRFTNNETNMIIDIISNHMTMHSLSDYKDDWKIFKFAKTHDFNAFCNMLKSDCGDLPKDVSPSDYEKLMSRPIIKFCLDPSIHLPEKIITGDDLIHNGCKPGKNLGKAIAWAYDCEIKEFVKYIESDTNDTEKFITNKERLLKEAANIWKNWNED